MPSKFNEQRLRCLYEAARLGTMRAASENLNMAPSSVSRQIARLEADFAMALIEKGRHRVHLTEAGQILYDYYRKHYRDQQSVIARLDDIQSLRTGKVTIAIMEGAVSNIVGPALNDFLSRFRDIHIDVRMLATTREIMGMVMEDEAHFGIAFDPDDDSRIRIRTRIDQPVKAIVHPSDTLARKKRIRLRDLTDRRVFLNQNFRMHEIIRDGERHEEFELNTVVSSNSISLLVSCVRNRLGVTFLSDIAVAQELADNQLMSIAVDNPALQKSFVGIFTRVGRQLPASAGKLLRQIESHLHNWQRVYKPAVQAKRKR